MNIDAIHNHCIDIDNRTIYLHGDAPIKDEEPGVDYRMMNKFIKNINSLQIQSKDPITIHMGTVGGCWNYGMAIYDAILNCPCQTTVIGYAWARSMSSIILQAADKRILMPHCDFMIHLGTAVYSGEYLTAQSQAEYDKKAEETMLRIYTNKVVEGPVFKNYDLTWNDWYKHLKENMSSKGDWWMSPQEAIDYGFADSIQGE